MKYFLCITFILGTVTAAQAAVARANFSTPSHPGQCVLDDHTILSPGQKGKAPNHPCARVTCMEGGHAEFKTCDAVAPPPGCRMRDFVNTKRDFPACCLRSYDCSKPL